MANMNKRLHDRLMPMLVERYGERCVRCGADGWILQELGRDTTLCIDHIDNNNSNNTISNLQLLCRSCNTKKNHPMTTEPTQRQAPPEFTAGKKNYKKAYLYVEGRLLDPKNNGALLLEPLIDDIANYVNCTQQSSKNYIAKMCSPKHGLMTIEERNADSYVVYKNDDELDDIINNS